MDLEKRLLNKFLIDHMDEGIKIIERLETEQIIDLLRGLPLDLASKILTSLSRFRGARCLERANVEFAVELLGVSDPSVNAKLLRMVKPSHTKILLDRLSSEQRRKIMQLIQYPEDTVGAHMNPAVLTLNENMRIEDAWKKINEYPDLVFTPLYIVSSDKKPVGFIEIKELITNEGSTPLRSIVNTRFPVILENINIQVLINRKNDFDGFPVIPVINKEGDFLGLLFPESIKSFAADDKSKQVGMEQAGIALGDLYQIGILSFIKTTTELSRTK